MAGYLGPLPVAVSTSLRGIFFLKKVPRLFLFFWPVRIPRTLTRRMAGYLGPLPVAVSTSPGYFFFKKGPPPFFVFLTRPYT
jgi:hypothetical protein